MFLKAPPFWYQKQLPFYAYPLIPISWLWNKITQFKRVFSHPYRVSVPVFCCGGLTVGGSGKTVICADLVKRLHVKGHNPHILMRGYKGELKRNKKVDPQTDNAQTVGDEALMLSYFGTVWIGKNRAISARMAIEDGADCLVMDDGFQNFFLKKDYSVLIIDQHFGLGNQHVLPAGPLREEARSGYENADAIVVIGNRHKNHSSDYTPPSILPHFYASFKQSIPSTLHTGDRIIAFCGIGHNEKFFSQLREHNLNLLGCFAFADHFPYTDVIIGKLIHIAQEKHAKLVTTRKDYYRIPQSLQHLVHVIDVFLNWEDSNASDKILNSFFQKAACLH